MDPWFPESEDDFDQRPLPLPDLSSAPGGPATEDQDPEGTPGYRYRTDLPGYRFVRSLFVDHSGHGSPGEPAMSTQEFKAWIEIAFARGRRYGYAILDVGPFQLYVGVYEREGKTGRRIHRAGPSAETLRRRFADAGDPELDPAEAEGARALLHAVAGESSRSSGGAWTPDAEQLRWTRNLIAAARNGATWVAPAIGTFRLDKVNQILRLVERSPNCDEMLLARMRVAFRACGWGLVDETSS